MARWGERRRQRSGMICRIISKIATTAGQHWIILRKAKAIHEGGAATSTAATETVLLRNFPRRQRRADSSWLGSVVPFNLHRRDR